MCSLSLSLSLSVVKVTWSGGAMDGSVSCLQVQEELQPEDHSTLLHQHMNEELQGGIVSVC